jgi:hypothetical protein
MFKSITWSHIYLTIIIQLIFGYILKDYTSGAIIASMWFTSREWTQAEYRWISMLGQGKRANMPWWAPFDIRVWKKLDPWLDWVLPMVVSSILAIIIPKII